MIGERTAEEIKIEIGSAVLDKDIENMSVRGRDLVTGLPKTISITAKEINGALEETVNSIIDAIKTTLEKTPPELAADIMDRGIVMTGGGSLLTGLDKKVNQETGMPVHIADEPMNCVVMGTGKVLEELDTLKRVLISPKKVG